MPEAAEQSRGTQEVAGQTALMQFPGEALETTNGAEPGGWIRSVPVEVDVAIPVHGFQVRSVLSLEARQVIVTNWVEGEDMPLAAHGAQLAWTEIEVIDQKLAVRITRLA